jgi:hypothetical protein
LCHCQTSDFATADKPKLPCNESISKRIDPNPDWWCTIHHQSTHPSEVGWSGGTQMHHSESQLHHTNCCKLGFKDFRLHTLLAQDMGSRSLSTWCTAARNADPYLAYYHIHKR